MKFHAVADLFPLMSGEEYSNLKEDIASNGLLEPIWLHADGSIIDGRNRYRACIETDTPIVTRTWSGNGSLIEFVLSLNLHRRHLTVSQRAAVAVEMLPMLAAEAKERQATSTGGTSPQPRVKLREAGAGRSDDKAGSAVGVSGKTVSDANAIAKEAPDLFEEMKTGDKTLAQSKRELGKRKKKEAPPLPTMGKYRVFYADPPWSYGNSGVIGDTDNYGHVERHYPSMTIEELCALEVKGMAEKDAVLFLWVTSPLLAECFDVIDAWGFKYKTSMVWDKVGHNFGHYVSVRHELLLICTRGSCTPDDKTLVDSVVEIEKTRKHSEKPEYFRELIDRLYPNGSRIELFARTSVDGWESWGNE